MKKKNYFKTQLIRPVKSLLCLTALFIDELVIQVCLKHRFVFLQCYSNSGGNTVTGLITNRYRDIRPHSGSVPRVKPADCGEIWAGGSADRGHGCQAGGGQPGSSPVVTYRCIIHTFGLEWVGKGQLAWGDPHQHTHNRVDSGISPLGHKREIWEIYCPYH